MNGYIVFSIAFIALAAYCPIRWIMARHKALRDSDNSDEERQLAKAYIQRAAFAAFIGILIFLTKIVWRHWL